MAVSSLSRLAIKDPNIKMESNGDICLRLASSDAAIDSYRRGSLVFAARKLRDIGFLEAAVALEEMAQKMKMARAATADDRFDISDVEPVSSSDNEDTQVIDMAPLLGETATSRRKTRDFLMTTRKPYRGSGKP
jgi:hypothetical protein